MLLGMAAAAAAMLQGPVVTQEMTNTRPRGQPSEAMIHSEGMNLPLDVKATEVTQSVWPFSVHSAVQAPSASRRYSRTALSAPPTASNTLQHRGRQLKGALTGACTPS